MSDVESDTKIAASDTPKLTPRIEGDTVFFDRQECREAGQHYHGEYVANRPFPHIVLDDFLPKAALRRIIDEFPQRETGRFADIHSNLKTGYQAEKIKSPYITNLINALNSAQFLTFIEEMTGIDGLLTDPHFAGAGLHETARGGHLSIHADFNIHPKLRARRRLNLIIYLNEGWKPEYGGALELWDKDMTACQKSVMPDMGRAVVFNTEADSLHGHPDPLASPEGIFRRSLALYYYTVPDANHLVEPVRSTSFKARPGTADMAPRRTNARSLMKDLTPPLVARWLRGRK